jgi:hypothetical protein
MSDLASLEEDAAYCGHPLMEVHSDCTALQGSDKLLDQRCAKIPENDGIVSLTIIRILEIGHQFISPFPDSMSRSVEVQQKSARESSN